MNEKPFAVVTGASSGIGFELAKQFAQNGFDLLVCAEDPGIERTAAELRSGDTTVHALQADLATYDGVERLYHEIQSYARPVEAIAINAGVGVGGDFARETSLEAELNLINLNVVSSVHLAKRVLKDMVARNRGKVLFTASVASVMPAPFEAVYGASKAFILMFSESLSNELKDTEIQVTAILPGPTETNFFHRAGMDDTNAGQMKKDDPAEVARRGFEALMANKDKAYVGSFKNRVMGLMSDLIPDNVAAAQHRVLSEPKDRAELR